MSGQVVRPSSIHAVLGHRADGTAITVADRIVTALGAGSYFEQACACAGVHRETAYEWLRVAARLRIRARDEETRSDRERWCVELSDAVERAEAQWELSTVTSLDTLGGGGVLHTVETVKTDADRTLIEKTVRSSRALPDARVLMWRLERRFPEQYGRRIEPHPPTAEHVLSLDERASALLESAKAFEAGQRVIASSPLTVSFCAGARPGITRPTGGSPSP